MRYIDIKVGLKYRVKEDIDIFIKRGAVVVIEKKAKTDALVQDLSKNKYMDGRWWANYSDLEPLKGIDPEEIKEGLRVHHKAFGKGTVGTVNTTSFYVKWDKKPLGRGVRDSFSRGGRFLWDDHRLFSCEELSILNEKDSAVDIFRKLQKECDEALLDALYDYSQRQCKEALEELKRLNALNEESLYWRREGNKIIFSFVKEGKTIETSVSCSSDDTFDYITGSQIALARLAQKCGKPAKVYLPKDTKDFQIEFI